jgi:hypothetical protein
MYNSFFVVLSATLRMYHSVVVYSDQVCSATYTATAAATARVVLFLTS